MLTSPLTGDYRKKKPASVKAADVAVSMTPVGSAVEIAEELDKEDPSYGKVAIIAAGDALGAAIPAMGPVAKSLIKQSDKVKDVWSYPEQLYDSADTSINVSKKPAGYNELKKRGEIKDGDVIVDIGGGRFDNLVEDAAEEGATVKVYDPFNRTPEHNAKVVDSVRDGQADMAMSHNVLNVIQEDKNIIDIATQAENVLKPNGKAHFSVYEGDGKGVGKVTTKGYQRNEKTQAYLPLIEQVFGKGNVTKRGKIITATKSVKGFSEGGMALEDQMEMNFGGEVPDNTIGVDPVSGNEIPLGSNAENVRDDIPANLSEGEIVIPADVVNFHGVKLFEDLRAEAKMGYAQMAQDGRMGGEPMMDEDMDIEITIEDLDVMDDEEPVGMARGGTSMAQYAPLVKKANSLAAHKAAMKRMSESSEKRNKRRRAAAASSLKAAPTNVAAVNPNAGPTIAQQINFGGKGGFDFRDKRNPIQKALGIGESATEAEVRKLAERAQIRRNQEARVEEIRQRRLEKEKQADLGNAASGSTGSDPLGGPGAGAVQYGGGGGGGQPNTFSVYDGTQGKSFGEVLGALDPRKLFMDEGGLVNPEPFYSQKGGFDLSSVNTAVVEYMNDEGHRIFITFVDGVPQMEIPEGYYPAGDAVSIDDVVNYTIPTMDGISSEPVQSSSSKRDKPSTPAPTPINYKELSVEEITQMIEDQKSLGNKFIKTINPLIRLAMWDQTRRLKAEIERRRDDPYTSEVDKRRYDQLLEIANADEPGLLATLLDKVTGKEPEAPVGRTQEQTDALYNQLDKMTKAYTPDPQEANNMQLLGFEGMGPSPDEGQPITTPGVDAEIPGVPGVPLTREQIEAAKQIAKEAAANAFSKPEEEPEPQPAPQTQVQQMRTTQQDNKEKKKQKARDRSKAFSLASKKTGDSIAKIGRTVAPSNERTNIDYGDPRRGMMSKGGIVKKKKSKKKKSK